MKKIMSILLVVFMVLLFTGCVEPKEPQYDMDKEQIVEEQITEKLFMKKVGDEMVVSTPYGDLKYPYAFSDIIKIKDETTTDSYKIYFNVVTDNFSAPIYTFTFEEENGITLGHIGDSIVSVEIVESEVELSDDNKKIFEDAQNTVGEIINSLYKLENFVPIA